LQIAGWNQEALGKSRVLIVGVGGIGSTAALGCARLGIGKIILIDLDEIEPSNLNRQLLYSRNDIGQKKAETAKANLISFHALSSQIESFDFNIFNRWTQFVKLVREADFIFNGLDLPEVKKLAVANLCLKLKKPMIYAGTDPISGNSGMILFQQPEGNPCYNCLTAAIHSVKEEFWSLLMPSCIEQQKTIPIEQMTEYSEISGATTVYTASIVAMMGVNLMIHWFFKWLPKLPNRIIVDLYNFTCETWIDSNSCSFCSKEG
jgi:hypothetical protein